MGKSFLVGNVLETAHTCLYDVFTRQGSVQHRDLSPGPNFGPNSGPKTGLFYEAGQLRQLRPDYRPGHGLIVSLGSGECSVRPVEHGRAEIR